MIKAMATCLAMGIRYAGRRTSTDFTTIAEIAGAKLSRRARAQIEGRSLVPLLKNPEAPWNDRTLFTNLGRWPKNGDPTSAKYKTCAVRTPRWHLVSPDDAGEPHWMLFDVASDPGETTDVKGTHPEVIKELSSNHDRWWDSVQGSFVNERAIGPAINPFKEYFGQQFGGGPSEEDLRLIGTVWFNLVA